MKTKYFTITDSESDNHNIGTVRANNMEELKKGVQNACESHFDCDTFKINFLDKNLRDLLGGYRYHFPIEMDIDNEPYEGNIIISQTWIY